MVASDSLARLESLGRIGRYEVLGRLATGGMAEVFLARDAGPQGATRLVAVKRVLPHVATTEHFREMFAHEARLSLQLRHPNICAIHEFAEEDDTYFLAMEWVDGVSLREVLTEAPKQRLLPIPIAVRIAADVASALDYAHGATDANRQPLHVVHRDVSPENVLLGFDGVVKLVDFGVAKAASQLHKTKTGMIKGKLGYMSPEHYQAGELDHRADVFSLGVCLFETLTGVNPFERGSEFETVAAICVDTTVPSTREHRTEIPEDLDRIVRRALARERSERYASADALFSALESFLATQPSPPRTRDVAALLAEWFAERVSKGPPLERIGSGARRPAQPVRERISTVERFAIAAELDQEEDRIGRVRRRRVRLLAVLLVVVVVGILATMAFLLQRAPVPSVRPVITHRPGRRPFVSQDLTEIVRRTSWPDSNRRGGTRWLTA